jgi:hypothetical protein
MDRPTQKPATESARARREPLEARRCVCGSEFTPTRENQRSCRPSCRALASRQARVSKYHELRAGLDALFGISGNGV